MPRLFPCPPECVLCVYSVGRTGRTTVYAVDRDIMIHERMEHLFRTRAMVRGWSRARPSAIILLEILVWE